MYIYVCVRAAALHPQARPTRVQAEFKFEGVAVDEAAFKNNLEVLELLDGKVHTHTHTHVGIHAYTSPAYTSHI